MLEKYAETLRRMHSEAVVESKGEESLHALLDAKAEIAEKILMELLIKHIAVCRSKGEGYEFSKTIAEMNELRMGGKIFEIEPGGRPIEPDLNSTDLETRKKGSRN